MLLLPRSIFEPLYSMLAPSKNEKAEGNPHSSKIMTWKSRTLYVLLTGAQSHAKGGEKQQMLYENLSQMCKGEKEWRPTS